MTDLKNIEQKIFAIINEVADENDKIVIKQFNMNLDLRDDFGLDSLDLAELTVKVEEEFGVDVFADGLVSKIQEIINKIS